MATTTNYGWTTPDDTALVKDGAAAIRTLGSSVDTTTKNLNPETTLGDIAYRSSTANVKTRLALGTAGQVLQVNSGANAPEWATVSSGGMTLLSTTTLSGATTTISGISGSYNILYGIISGVTNATASGNLICKPNATGSILTWIAGEASAFRNSDVDWNLNAATNSVRRTISDNVWQFWIYNYASTSAYKPINWTGYWDSDGLNAKIWGGGAIRTNSAITSLEYSNSGGNFSTGTVLLYGVK